MSSRKKTYHSIHILGINPGSSFQNLYCGRSYTEAMNRLLNDPTAGAYLPDDADSILRDLKVLSRSVLRSDDEEVIAILTHIETGYSMKNLISHVLNNSLEQVIDSGRADNETIQLMRLKKLLLDLFGEKHFRHCEWQYRYTRTKKQSEELTGSSHDRSQSHTMIITDFTEETSRNE